MMESIIALVGVLLGVGVTLTVAKSERRQRDDELFLTAIEYLTGKTQVRNVGIAAVELLWHKARFRRVLFPALCGSVTYLLLESEAGDAEHEIFNLERIIALLLAPSRKRPSTRRAYDSLRRTLRRKLEIGNAKGLHVGDEVLSGWLKQLDDIG